MAAVLLLTIPTLAERIARTARRDLLLFTPLILIPIGFGCFILTLLQSSLLYSSTFVAVGFSIISSVGAFLQVTLPVIAPPAFPGRPMAVMSFANNVIGLGLGVFLVGFLADTVFRGPGSLGRSLLAIVCAIGPAVWLLFYLAWKRNRAATSRQADAPIA